MHSKTFYSQLKDDLFNIWESSSFNFLHKKTLYGDIL